jgi:hypothetical protein
LFMHYDAFVRMLLYTTAVPFLRVALTLITAA